MSTVKRIDEVKLIPKPEIARRLAKMRRAKAGMHPTPGPGIAHACVCMATGLARVVIFSASYGRGVHKPEMSDRTQLILSMFFARYDGGEFSFAYCRSPKGKSGVGHWEMTYHANPAPREETVAVVTLTESGPRLGMIKLNRTWV